MAVELKGRGKTMKPGVQEGGTSSQEAQDVVTSEEQLGAGAVCIVTQELRWELTYGGKQVWGEVR